MRYTIYYLHHAAHLSPPPSPCLLPLPPSSLPSSLPAHHLLTISLAVLVMIAAAAKPCDKATKLPSYWER